MLIGKPSYNNIFPCYMVPPREDRPFQSPRLITFTKEKPEIDYQAGTSLPNKIIPDMETINREISKEEKLSGKIIQINQDDQYVLIKDPDTKESSLFKLLNCRIDHFTNLAPKSKLILPGQIEHDDDSIFRLEFDFLISEITDPELKDNIIELCDKVIW